MVYIIVALIVVGLYFLFRDTMNRLQYVQTFRIYWITRDTGVKSSPIVSRAFMRQTSEPWWRGSGVQFRAGKYTFQIGVLTGKGSSLLDQVGGRDMDESPAELRKWGMS